MLRRAAECDVDSAVDIYSREGGSDVALAFVDALNAAYHAIGARPATGPPRFAHELNLPGLRSRALGKFPYRIFCLERADHIDVWRVLDARRDIPAWLGDANDERGGATIAPAQKH